MKIVKIETFARPFVGLLRVTTDDGATGWGQIASTEAADIVARALHRQVARAVLGRDDRDALVDAILERNLKFPGSYICRGAAAVELALLDLEGKRRGKAVWELLGGRGDPVPVYGSSMSRTIKPEEEAERMARLRQAHGYRAFKVRVGQAAGHDRDAWPGRTEALIPAVRAALDREVVIHADANSCYTPARALEVGRMLEDHGTGGHFEEPCPYWELDWTRAVTEKLEIPVAGGEQDNSMPVWRQMIREHVVDIVQPDICYLGGVGRTLRVARLAAEYGLVCVPHSANHSLVTVATLHAWSAISNHGPFLELSIEDQSAARSMFTPSLEVRDGVCAIPDQGPGWGITVAEAWLRGSERLLSELGPGGELTLGA